MRKTYNPQKLLFCQWSDHKLSTQLQKASEILDELPEVLRWVAADLRGGKEISDTGANGMTAEQVLRAALLKQMNEWSYEFLSFQCVDSNSTKVFMRLEDYESYSSSCLQENITKIRAQTWQKINDAIVALAAEKGWEKGRTIRIDSTVVETNIHHPTDSSLLFDCIRVANDALKVIRKKERRKMYLSVSTKDAKRLLLKIINCRGQQTRKQHYRDLLKLAKRLDSELQIFLLKLASTKAKRQYERLKKVSYYLPLIIDQARRRVIKGEKVSSEDKVVSIFEDHTDIIVKGRRATEYGHKVFLSSGKSGLVTRCDIASGNPADSEFFMGMIEDHKKLFGKVPRQTTADGGFASEDNVYGAKELGVSDVCFSKRCGLEIEEMVKSTWVFEKLRNFRAGIEGIISVLKRAFGLSRSLWQGAKGYASYVHSAVVSYNLATLGRLKCG